MLPPPPTPRFAFDAKKHMGEINAGFGSLRLATPRALWVLKEMSTIPHKSKEFLLPASNIHWFTCFLIMNVVFGDVNKKCEFSPLNFAMRSCKNFHFLPKCLIFRHFFSFAPGTIWKFGNQGPFAPQQMVLDFNLRDNRGPRRKGHKGNLFERQLCKKFSNLLK